jgi:peptidyl-tRNA hydrolase, PTH1 family
MAGFHGPPVVLLPLAGIVPAGSAGQDGPRTGGRGGDLGGPGPALGEAQPQAAAAACEAARDREQAQPEAFWLPPTGGPGQGEHLRPGQVRGLAFLRVGARFKAHRTRNGTVVGRLVGQAVTLARPRSYMNLSGGPVAALMAFYELPAGHP